jgi:hypothetical protein
MSEEHKLLRPAMCGAGRPPGALNKLTRDLRQAMLDGAVSSDYALDPDDEDAPGSLTHYMKTVANKHPELFFQALAKLIPHEIKSHSISESTVDIAFHSLDQVKMAMLNEGFSTKQVQAIEKMLPLTGNEQVVDDQLHDVEQEEWSKQ